MKKILLFSLIVLALASCGNPERKSSQQVQDPVRAISGSAINNSLTQKDSILHKGRQILMALRAGDYTLFSNYFSRAGVYFSPYGFLDTANCKHLSSADFLESIQKNWILTWGSFDGTGEPIKLTTQAFFKKFVYNVDYLQAKQIGYNEVLQKGNSLVNIDNVFPEKIFVDYHFSGFDKRYQGMDWTSLVLVFSKEENEYRLLGVVHHQWTI